MPNICDFELTVKGETAQLEKLLYLIESAVVTAADSYFFDASKLDLNFGDDVVKQSVGLANLNEDSHWRAHLSKSPYFQTEIRDWYAVQTPLSMSEIQCINVGTEIKQGQRIQRTQEALDAFKCDPGDPVARQTVASSLFQHSEPIEPVKRYVGLLDQPMPRLCLVGQSAWAPPSFVKPLSEMWPSLAFEIIGTMDHFEYDKLIIKNGMEFCVYHFVENIQAKEVIWYVKDGVEIAEPKWEALDVVEE